MSGEQRALLADKLADVANIAAGALVFGQFFGGGGFSIPIGLLGVAVWTALVASSLGIAHGGGQ